MSQLILPSRLVSQPQYPPKIDWSQTLSKGLVIDVGGHSAGVVAVRNLVLGDQATFGTGVSVSHGKWGKELRFSGSQAATACALPDNDKYDGYTQATWQIMYWAAASPTYGDVLSKSAGGEGSWRVGDNSGNLMWLPAYDSVGYQRRFDLSSCLGDLTLNHLVLSWRGLSDRTIIVNGVDKTSSSTAVSVDASTQANSTKTVMLGRGDLPLCGGIVLARMWDRGKSVEECLELSRNPWQIYSPIRRKIFIPTSASHTLTAATSVQGNTSGAVAITQGHSLVSASTTQANNSSSVVISQAHTLLSAASVQGNTSSGVAVTQGHVLIVSGDTQVAGSSDVQITQDHSLVSSNSSQANASLSVELLTGTIHNLVCAPSSQDNVADASAIVQAHILLAAASTQANVSASVALPAGSEVWPAITDVRLGVSYGPTGSDYVGTMTAGSGTYPTAEDIATAVWAKGLP